MNNPYAAPTAAMSDEIDRHGDYQPKMFSTSGRIGRLRYMAYSTGLYMIIMLVISLVNLALMGLGGSGVPKAIPTVLLLAAGIMALVQSKRRLHDLDLSGTWNVAMFIPFVNLLLWLYLVFGSGDTGDNQYGPPPASNPRWMWIMATVPLGMVVLGILAAVALPAYQQYVLKAKAAQVRH